MRTTPADDDLELPPLDHEREDDSAPGGELVQPPNAGVPRPSDPTEAFDDDLPLTHEIADAFDDAAHGGAWVDELGAAAPETGWLVDADEGGKAMDVGTFALSVSNEDERLEPDEPEVRLSDDELGDEEEVVHNDGGEEGPLADDEELREEDLPALDADDDGDVADDALFERGSIDVGEELRWEDRAWARLAGVADGSEGMDAEDGGVSETPFEDPKHASRDAVWKRLEKSGNVTAFAHVPGDSVVVAVEGPDRTRLVRVMTDGVARIIAEIEPTSTDDDGSACRVTAVRWDVARGCLVATGTFGVQAFRPV